MLEKVLTDYCRYYYPHCEGVYPKDKLMLFIDELYDHNEILELYKLGYSVIQISEKIQCERSTISKVLKVHGVKSRGNSDMIDQFDLAGNYIQTFDSSVEAAQWIINNNLTTTNKIKTIRGAIRLCCQRKRNSAYGYKWILKIIP